MTFLPSAGGASLSGINPVVVSDTELSVEVPDGTALAAGADTLATTVTASFTDSSQGGALVSSLPSVTGANAYTYGAPVIDSIAPVAGPLAGGTAPPSPARGSRIRT